MENETEITWDDGVEEKFRQMIGKIPKVLQGMAKKQVLEKSHKLVVADHRSVITEKDMVDAFFEVTPFGFHGPMKCDMEEFGIDYVGYGHPE